MYISGTSGHRGHIKQCIFSKQHLKNVKIICLQNLNKQCLKLDSRPILYAYNLLGYGETLSEKYGKSKQSKKFENVPKFSILF